MSDRSEPSTYVLDLAEVDPTRPLVVGGKGAHLAALARTEGVRVPPGFCVTTAAFDELLAAAPSLDDRLARLSQLSSTDYDAISTLSADVREALESAPLPDEVTAAIARALATHGESAAYAVRSSATAEDLPSASFAGQQDTYLNVVGAASVVEHVRRCFASLFTERAVTYRLRNGFDHRSVRMAVVVQRMVTPRASGVLFTADPITSNRKVTYVEATFGLGEALVSGLVTADVYQVRDGEIVGRRIANKALALRPSASGGVEREAIPQGRQAEPALLDEQLLRLARLGRRIEARFGCPQDIEWCLVDDEFHFVQARPITTLFPIPPTSEPGNRVYLSVGHQQMMTDAIKPLGMSIWQLTAARPMYEAGGRLFVDVTQALASPAMREMLMTGAGRSDPLVRDALETVLASGFLQPSSEGDRPMPPPGAVPPPPEPDPAVVPRLMERYLASLATVQRESEMRSGPEVFDFILADVQELKRCLFDPESHRTWMSAMDATWWLNEHLEEWLGEKNAATVLTQSVPHNVTSEMGLALLDVADAIRPHPAVVAFLEGVGDDDTFLDELPKHPGGAAARDAIERWLERYGARGVGEIDVTKPRFRERPSTLVPLLLGNLRRFEPGEAARRFERGRQGALAKEQELLARLRALPDGEEKARETKQRIDLVRTFMGYREFPKYQMVTRYFVYKRAMLREVARLVDEGVLRETEDAYFLRFEELHEAVRTRRVDHALIDERKAAFRSYEALTPPRVLTSDGECISGSHRREGLPDGALAGSAVSAGIVEGRARVILDITQAALEPGDILVTAYTDPSWTPLFVAVKGLVTEVGGVMSHGAVITREYGLPAVVGVTDATKRIRDGQRIRVDGTEGYVELLP